MMILSTQSVLPVLGLLDVTLKLQISALFVIVFFFKQYFVRNMGKCLCSICVPNFTRRAPLVHYSCYCCHNEK